MIFLLLTAWRDARRQRRRLLFSALSIVFGVAALVAVDSFSANVNEAVEAESKTLLGADIEVSSRLEFSPVAERWIQDLGGEVARETRFASMAFFPRARTSRLVQVRALSDGFPFYGEIETEPPLENPIVQSENGILVDPVILSQYSLKLGDTIEIGDAQFIIQATLKRIPGEAAFAGVFAPRAYIALDQLEKTGLIGTGSIAVHRAYIANPTVDPESIEKEQRAFLDEQRLRIDTIAERKDDIGKPLTNLARFLGLVGFVALLLGGVGIAGAIYTYLREKRDTVAILRCLGASSKTATLVFLLQVATVALIATAVGAVLGVGVQTILPRVLAPLLPFEMAFALSISSIASGVGYGLVTALLFSCFPLLSIRKISPLSALRSSYETERRQRDPLLWKLGAFAVVIMSGFCMTRTDPWWHGGIFALALILIILIFYGIAELLKALLFRVGRPPNYLLRQALANLHRPNNRTAFLILSLGLGTFLVVTLSLIQEGLLQQTDIANSGNEPNLLLFDIQSDQLDGLKQIVARQGLEITEEAPVVTMRLAAVKERSVKEIKADPEQSIDRWILNREWRSTYRSAPGPSEQVVAGEYVSEWPAFKEPVPVSLEDDMAGDLGVQLGDTLIFDVQGVDLQVKVASLRKVDWKQMRPNFFMTFPDGVLNGAPQWWITVLRSPSSEATAELQSEVFLDYPNISVVDLNIVIESLQSFFGRINFAVRFMGLFTVATGLVILAGAIATSRYQRIQESVLLRTLGAGSDQIRAIMAIEFAVIGFLSALSGVGLGLVAAAALGQWVFKVEYHIPWGTCISSMFFITGLTLATGLFSSRGIATHPPLETLRKEMP